MSAFVIEDIFTVSKVDPDGKKFDRVSRLILTSEALHLTMLLDVNVELYPMRQGERFSVALSKTISLDGQVGPMDDGLWHPNPGPTLADQYEYVMWGKAFKMEEAKDGQLALLVSFGGLLMRLESEARHLQNLSLGTNLYLLVRRV